MKWILASLALAFLLRFLWRRLPRDTRAVRPSDSDLEIEPDLAPEPIGDELDLHGVEPREVDELVDAFVDDARERGRRLVKIIHGKGIGARRQQVRARLARHPGVERFHDADAAGSGWGATVVHLRPADPDLAETMRPDLR